MITRPLSENRTYIYCLLVCLCLLSDISLAIARSDRPRPPFRILFSNDSTNILACDSPFYTRPEPFTESILKASIDETVEAGCDVHMFQPGVTFVPLWKSEIYPADQHYIWWKETFNLKSGHPFIEYMADGGDIVGFVVEQCRKKKIAPFISFRLNDWHFTEFLDAPQGFKVDTGSSLALDRFRRENENLARVPRKNRLNIPYDENFLKNLAMDRNMINFRDSRVLNFAESAVRDYLFSLIEEVCQNYDIDGIELDFLRHYFLFSENITSLQRKNIMNTFVERIRKMLDQSSKPGQYRWLCMRIPAFLSVHDPMGIDIEELDNIGVDMFNLGNNYFTVQQTDLSTIVANAPGVACYSELYFAVRPGYRVEDEYGEAWNVRMTTAEQLETAAHVTYAQGGQGVSLFNFAYYRPFGHPNPEKGPFGEPPFEVIKYLRDSAALAKRPQHYFITDRWQGYMESLGVFDPGLKYTTTQNPIEVNTTTKLKIYMYPPAGGWKNNGRLRLQSYKNTPFSEDTQILLSINQKILKQTNNISEPYPTEFTGTFGKPMN